MHTGRKAGWLASTVANPGGRLAARTATNLDMAVIRDIVATRPWLHNRLQTVVDRRDSPQ